MFLLLAVIVVVLIPLMTWKLYRNFKLRFIPIGIGFGYFLLMLLLLNIGGSGIGSLAFVFYAIITGAMSLLTLIGIISYELKKLKSTEKQDKLLSESFKEHKLQIIIMVIVSIVFAILLYTLFSSYFVLES